MNVLVIWPLFFLWLLGHKSRSRKSIQILWIGLDWQKKTGNRKGKTDGVPFHEECNNCTMPWIYACLVLMRSHLIPLIVKLPHFAWQSSLGSGYPRCLCTFFTTLSPSTHLSMNMFGYSSLLTARIFRLFCWGCHWQSSAQLKMKYFILGVMNLYNIWVSLFKCNYWNEWTFHSILIHWDAPVYTGI